MEIFVLATDNDMNMHAKTQSMNMHLYLQKNTLSFTLCNFIQCFIEQKGVRLISICRSALKEYTEIFLIFFRVVLYFLHILKFI
jgi:hypothetical protein